MHTSDAMNATETSAATSTNDKDETPASRGGMSANAKPASAKTVDNSTATADAKSQREAELDRESADARRIAFRYLGTSR